jgi:hypothetical protein
LTDGDKLGKTVHDLITDALNEIPPEQRGKIQLDADSVGAVNIHKFDLPKNPALDKVLATAGDNRSLYLAFRDDALFLTLGKEALPTLKLILAKKDSAASLPLLFDFDVARMALLMARSPDHKELAATLFPGGQHGRVRLAIEGGATLNARLQMSLNVLEFLVKIKNYKAR